MDPALRMGVTSLRDIEAHSTAKDFPKNKYCDGTLGVIDRVDYEQMTVNLHIVPYVKDHYDVDEKHDLWS